jgi:hypothetical protein
VLVYIYLFVYLFVFCLLLYSILCLCVFLVLTISSLSLSLFLSFCCLDMSADRTALLVNRALVPLDEAFLLLGPSFREVAVREQAVMRCAHVTMCSVVWWWLRVDC